ncbi:squalene synthase HpnC [Oryzisolibacter propanilivorax]|uniref:Squalene synthase HpnC n=1 Tax=Oryzisolibacter propanilivorax TaxID=1527607 RepID=A0A1G9NZ81_9BURK|nr:squalene synthase HpnC [Oryzisolibacter propanilivorax]SDL91710.1 squalene synthase HpnC [Oryzisolibacter propanilivorax]
MKPSPPRAAEQPAPVTHYENFPVASILCPPALRAPIAALYAFARTADDLADEGDAAPAQRLADLRALRAGLHAVAAGQPPEARWQPVLAPLGAVLRSHRLPLPLLDDLLDAFAQDVHMTVSGATYPDRAALLDYCRRSANPVGRLLLHLYGVHGAAALARSDAICTALQLANFWQDLSVDLPRGRHYLTDADCAAHGVARADLAALRRTPASDALVLDCAAWARGLMLQGAPLVHAVPGRAGWELRLVVQGGLRILEQVQALGGASLVRRPTVRARDWPLLLWRALRM